MARLVRRTPGVVGRGIGGGISRIPSSDVGPSALGIEGGVDFDRDELGRSPVDGRFLLQGRRMAGVGPLACWGGSLELSAEGLLPASVGAGRGRLG